MNVAVVAVHPDDEILGVGGTILKHVSKGDNVYIIIVTKGSDDIYSAEVLAEKRKEAEQSANMLGVKKIFFCDFIAAQLDAVPLNSINICLRKIFDECKPDVVYIPHEGDMHQDHKVVFNSCMVVLRPEIGRTIKEIYCYETVSESEWSSPYSKIFIPNYYSDISDFLDKKLKILGVYKSELKEFPHPRSVEAVKIKAMQRGSEVCLNAAEVFMLIRKIC